MSRKPLLPYLLGCATLPVIAVVLSIAAAGWAYFSVPVEAGQGHDGSSAGTAMIVETGNEEDAINAEYTWLMTRRPWDVVMVQSLVPEGGRAYDVFTLQTPEGEMYTLHFDITDSYGKWE